MYQRAFTALEVKGVNEEQRVITGLATSPVPDRIGDVVNQFGAKFAKTIPLFMHHDSTMVVGHVELGKATADGITFKATFPKIVEPGTLQQRVDEAWQSVKYKLIAAVSIGFKEVAGKVERLKSGGLHFLESEILELSLVPIPMQQLATVHTIKSFNAETRAALGLNDSALRAASGLSKTLPGASGYVTSPTVRYRLDSITRSLKGKEMQTLSQLREERNTKHARMQELVDVMKADDHEATEEETSEFDELETEVKSLDTEIRVARFQAVNVSTAKAVDGTNSARASASRGGEIIVKNTDPDDKFPGQSFARIVKAKAVAFILGEPVGVVAQKMYGRTSPRLVAHIKAAVPGGGTGSGEWGAELVGIDNRYNGDFVTYLHGRTGFDQLGLREAPLNVAVKGMDGAAIGYWVGESKAIPASAPSASTTDLTGHKLGGKCVMSNELMMDSSPGAELMVRDALAEALALRLDQTFFSAVAASAGVSPAGILNGLTQIAIGSQDAAGLRAFINAAAAGFISAKTASGLVLVTSPGTALAIGMLVNALGQSEFPSLIETGGSLLGRRVVVSDNIDPSQIILLNPREIWKIGDGGVEFAISREAMVEQNDAPQGASDTPVASSATLVSMFDTDSVAIRATRRVSWKLRRAAAAVVAFTDSADFGGVSS